MDENTLKLRYGNGTRLHKYQWDKVHNKDFIVGLLEDDEDALLKSTFNSKYIILETNFKDKVTKAGGGKVDFLTEEAVNYAEGKLAQLDKLGKKTYIYLGFKLLPKDKKGKETADINYKFNKIIEDTLVQLGIADANVLKVAYVRYWDKVGDDVFELSDFEKFELSSNLDANCEKQINDEITKSLAVNAKRFTFKYDDAIKDRADILYNKLKDCKKEELPKEIVIHYQRRGRNDYRSWGTFTILGTNYTGYVLERPKGSNPSNYEKYKRHPSGTYELDYSENVTRKSDKFDNVTLYTKQNTRYILHGGNRADQSDGCLLINDNSPKNDKYPNSYQFDDPDIPSEDRTERTPIIGVANDYYDHKDIANPAKKLRDKVFLLENTIKDARKIQTVTKKIIIDESLEIID